MDDLYDKIGEGYSVGRKTDPDIASQIYQYLDDAESILNIGAGSGSYELKNKNLVAIEPSISMINQRPQGGYPVKQGSAESLPFYDASFTHVMTILSMHHWNDRTAAFNEIKRVVTKRFVALTWDPDAEPYWLTKDYFPEIHDIDQSIFPSLNELENTFSGIKFYPLLIPSNCFDGFTAAYWARPLAYLDSTVRNGMSTFLKIKNLDQGVLKLERDLKSGYWYSKHGDLKCRSHLDVGYKVAVWDV